MKPYFETRCFALRHYFYDKSLNHFHYCNENEIEKAFLFYLNCKIFWILLDYSNMNLIRITIDNNENTYITTICIRE